MKIDKKKYPVTGVRFETWDLHDSWMDGWMDGMMNCNFQHYFSHIRMMFR